jgi:hypothetical protein
MFPTGQRCRIPLWVKVAYTAFMAILIPVYLKNYGPTNFLYFCDVAAIMTLVAVWTESPLLLSAALVGIFLPQMLWVADFLVEVGARAAGKDVHLTGMTSYMFRPPFFLRFLSFFHFWLPFLLAWLVWRVGYDRRALLLWTGIAWVLVTVCFAFLPAPSPTKDADGKDLRNADVPVNVNYVYNIASDEKKQEWMEENAYFALYVAALFVVVYLPTHLLFRALMPRADEKRPWGLACAARPEEAPIVKAERVNL